ncbi:MAG: hypothetical protein ACXWUG_05800 [Polyangiales bacterium]
MRAFLVVSSLCLCACGGKTDTTPTTDAATDTGTTTDTGPTTDTPGDTAPACFDASGLISVPYKVCSNDSDCTFLAHQTDCCGNSTWVGVNKDQKVEVSACESAVRASFPGCGCPAGQPKAEDGSTLDFGAMPVVHCTDRTSSSGICKTSKS